MPTPDAPSTHARGREPTDRPAAGAAGDRPPRRLTPGMRLSTAVVFAVALVPRLAHLGRFVTWDEPAWALRTLRFWQAMLDGRWAETIPSAHPGVLTVWLGGLGLAVERWRQPAAVAQAWQVAADLPGLRDTDDAALKALGAILPGLTWPVAVFHAAGIALAYRLAARLVGPGAAAVFAVLLALDPFAVGLSRVLHVDALQMTCGTVAALAAGAFARRGDRRHVLLAGCATALAALAKLPGLAVAAPVAVLALWPRARAGAEAGADNAGAAAPGVSATEGAEAMAIVERAWPARWRSAVVDLATLAAAAVLTAVALWPALWADPAATLGFVYAGSTKYAGRAVDTAHFFLGSTVDEPGPRFYPVAFAFRLAPLMFVGLGLSAVGWRRMRAVERRVWVVAIGLAIGYTAALSLSPKKFDRYLLPTWPAWALAAALGYRAAGRGRDPRAPAMRLAAVAVAGLGAYQARAALDPYAVAWYAPYLGGTAGAVAAIPVGWGEGFDAVADAVAAGGVDLGAAPGQTAVLATTGVPGLAPRVDAAVIPLDPEALAHADAVVRYVADAQAPTPDWLAPVIAQAPVLTTTVHGVPYAWLYRNAVAADLAATLRAEPATVLTGGADHFARHLDGVVVLGDGADAVAEGLAAVAPAKPDRTRDLWLVTHPLAPGPAEAEAAFWLDTHAHRLARVETVHTTITRYRLADDVAADGRAAWSSVPADPAAGSDPVPRFGAHVRLTDARWTTPAASWTRAAAVRLTWTGLTDADEDLTALVHVRDAEGHLWGQVDVRIPRPDARGDGGDDGGDRGMGGAGVEVTQDILVYPWPGTPPGGYDLWVGVYRAGDGARLPPGDTADRPVEDDRVRIGAIEVGHSPRQPTADDIGLPIALDADLGPVHLRGAALMPSGPARPGDAVTVHLLWEVVDAATGLAGDVRLSLPGAGGELAGASETLTEAPLCPAPCDWRVGERMRTQHTVRVPDTTTPGRHALNVALARGSAGGGAMTIGELEVVGAK